MIWKVGGWTNHNKETGVFLGLSFQVLLKRNFNTQTFEASGELDLVKSVQSPDSA